MDPTAKKDEPATILVVEDDNTHRALMSEVLEVAGHRCVAVPGGKEALAALDQELPDALFLDVLMPDMDGFEVCRRVRMREDCVDLPVVMMTGLHDSESIHKAFESGATDFLTKPLQYTLLKYRIQYMLRNSRSNRQLRVANEQVRRLAYVDGLTGLPNRAQFRDRVAAALHLAERHKRRFATLFLDLDRFKLINDSLGHAAGDQLLQQVASRIRNTLRTEDAVQFGETGELEELDGNHVARLGGDEFTILLSEIEAPEDAAIVAKRLLVALNDPYTLEGQQTSVSPSIGIATFPEDGNDIDSLLKQADLAMYNAKRNGRNGYSFVEPN